MFPDLKPNTISAVSGFKRFHFYVRAIETGEGGDLGRSYDPILIRGAKGVIPSFLSVDQEKLVLWKGGTINVRAHMFLVPALDLLFQRDSGRVSHCCHRT